MCKTADLITSAVSGQFSFSNCPALRPFHVPVFMNVLAEWVGLS